MARSISDPLPSWNDGAAKRAILDFVRRVSTDDSRDHVPENERIAVFDNDGTLWCEMPVPVQAFFTADRIRALGPTGMTTDEFDTVVRDWIATARHPKTGMPYTKMVYQPMLELLRYLHNRGFTTFIVSGGNVEFVRVFAEDVYGLPPENVIGSTIETHVEVPDGTPVPQRDAALDLFDDRAGKPAAINTYIGRRPILCVGNSDGDREMLTWATLNRPDGLPSLGIIIHHTDGEREFAYDRQRVVSGHLDQGLDEAPRYGWVLADMKQDWNRVFPT